MNGHKHISIIYIILYSGRLYKTVARQPPRRIPHYVSVAVRSINVRISLMDSSAGHGIESETRDIILSFQY